MDEYIPMTSSVRLQLQLIRFIKVTIRSAFPSNLSYFLLTFILTLYDVNRQGDFNWILIKENRYVGKSTEAICSSQTMVKRVNLLGISDISSSLDATSY